MPDGARGRGSPRLAGGLLIQSDRGRKLLLPRCCMLRSWYRFRRRPRTLARCLSLVGGVQPKRAMKVQAYQWLRSFEKSFKSDKTIPDTNHRFDTSAAGVHLLPQPADMNVERPRVAKITVTPNVIEKLLPGRDTARILDQVR